MCGRAVWLVLTSSAALNRKDSARESTLLVEMKWGLIPSWLKNDQSAQMSYKMVNARSDGLMQKPTFKKLLNEGRRCVFIVEGFYEWQETKNGKQPFYIHLKSGASIDKKFIKGETTAEVVTTKNLMFIAGLFDTNEHVERHPVDSFTVITVPSSKIIQSIHDRMPAILGDSESIRKWLDCEHVGVDEALKLLKPYDEIVYYPVSKRVNNVSYKDSDCVEPLESSAEQTSISKFFTKATLPRKTGSDDEITPKKKRKVSE